MNPLELVVGISLILVVVVVAIYFIWRQLKAMRALRWESGQSLEDRRFVMQQSMRRIFNSVLMLIFAALLLGGFFLFPPEPMVGGVQVAPDDQTKDEIRMFTAYWIFVLLVLLAILALAVVDFWATARFGFRHQKQLEQDRRAMLAEEAARIRQRRQELN